MKAAGVYGRIGWAVVPLHSAVGGVCSCAKGSSCPNAGKHPRVNDWTREASSDPEEIAAWAKQWPAGNTGVATGSASGFWILDVDPKNGGVETLESLVAEHGPLPKTVEALTGSGGSHRAFNLPPFKVTNSAGKIGKGLDVRGDGGQIVVAPSVSAKGAYRWVNAPWDTPIADAPTWLLELLRSAPRSTTPAKPTLPRGAYPPASPAVLERAREALEAHGPAIEGEGGDQHTFIAAALLVHDFALSEDQAWPLLIEWNEGCQPPWSEDELAAKLRGGGKYGSKPYGCRRATDAVEAARALIDAWLGGPRLESQMFELIAQVRAIAEVCGDMARHAVITRDLSAATGLSPRALALPRPAVNEDTPPGAIEVTPALHEVADNAIAAIAPHVFSRNGVLCEVAKNERTFIADLEPARIVDLMSRSAKWVRHDDKGVVVQAPPMPVAQILHARRSHPRVRVLEAVTTAPVFLADGSILQTRGYNAQARLFLEPSVAVDVADDPTREDAREAVRTFKRLLCDFRFHGAEDFSAWLAGLLSSIVKPATGNAPGPLICVSASSPGAGKSLLTGIASRIIDGRPPEIRPYNPRDPGEWGKRVTAFVRAGTPISVFDNVNGPFGDETIDRLVTSSSWSDRVLGASDAPPIAIVTTWWATGNHIEPQGDTVRRVLMVRIRVDEERPQERTGFKTPKILQYVQDHRAELLSAALTILRAYHVAGRPDMNLPEWGSFEDWSALVRGALVWTGCVDPFVSQRRAAEELLEPENETHDWWIGVVENSDGSPSSIAAAANTRNATEVLGVRDSITPYSLKKFLRRFIDKPRVGKRLRRQGTHYIVERITPPS